METHIDITKWQKEFEKECKSLALHLGYANSGNQKIDRLKLFITNLLEAVAVACEETKYTPIDAAAYLYAVRYAKHPFDDGFNHGREVTYEHVANLIRSLKGDE